MRSSLVSSLTTRASNGLLARSRVLTISRGKSILPIYHGHRPPARYGLYVWRIRHILPWVSLTSRDMYDEAESPQNLRGTWGGGCGGWHRRQGGPPACAQG